MSDKIELTEEQFEEMKAVYEELKWEKKKDDEFIENRKRNDD